MKPVLIGSRALQFWQPSLTLKESTDFDVISESHIDGCEFHDAEFLNNRHMSNMYTSFASIELPDGSEANVMSMLGLAIIKRSHLWRSLNFDRHITFFHKFGLADSLYTFRDNLTVQNHLAERINLTREAFPQGNPSLMQTKQDFFDDYVTKKYDHDYLHELVAFYEKPLYTRLLRNTELVWCEKEKWDTLSHSDKVKCVAEETFVIAIERFMIPNAWKFPSKLAYMKSLNKVCTTLCSGWFRDFAIDFYSEVMLKYDNQVFDAVKTTLKE